MYVRIIHCKNAERNLWSDPYGLRVRGLGRAIERVWRSLERARGAKTRHRLLERVARLTELRSRLVAAGEVA